MDIRRRIVLAITLTSIYIVASCNDDITAPDTTASPVGSIVLELESDTLSVEQTTQLQAIALTVSGDTLAGTIVTFESGDEDIATISDTGLVTAIGPGSAEITARADDRASSITIYVRRAASISVAPSDTTLVVDDRLKLVATVLDAAGAPVEGAVVSWFGDGMSDLMLLKQEGLAAEFLATHVGNEVITATTEGLTFDVNVTIDHSDVGSVSLLPDSLTIERGNAARLTAIVRDTTGAVIADPHVAFSSFCDLRSGGGVVATVDSTGLVTGVSEGGSCRIIARSRGVSSNTVHIRVIVAPSEVGSVLLLPDSLTVAVGGTAQLTVIVRDTTGATIRWAPGDVEFFCGILGQGPPGRCWINEQVFADVTSTGLVTRVCCPNIGPEPIVARYQGVFSNTTWLTTR